MTPPAPAGVGRYCVSRSRPRLAAIWLKAAMRLPESLAGKYWLGDDAQSFSSWMPCASIGSDETLNPIV